ncbi:hypothetical protein SAMD00019534_004540 [Acytostelium subglobosum LB1]|uniref:hypothetical protein n=1 Tax=Acytostelium subglobosum LB1 TaxID=1410327 RepID=UPI0006448B90|nr:hypothetical protein SAMD00019534_004540 [Acytostelium subglobosum LB1]GAM17279.1 hypothetical protein SAMD00019534_004540 [Acytostelium subglobosum LB1]|eukprot:XP_012759341.1 hypothetical protein SAMD00019534_004540 [Acytostelium subglobosum LB1]
MMQSSMQGIPTGEDVLPASSTWRKHALNTGRRYPSKQINFVTLDDRSIENISVATAHNKSSQMVICDTTSRKDCTRIVKLNKGNKPTDKTTLSVVRDFIQEGPIRSVDWLDRALLLGSANDGQIFMYDCSESDVSDPVLQETYTITRLKGVKDITYPVGAMGVDTSIKAVSVNKLASEQTFGCLENNAFHIWEFKNPVQPIVSFRASEMPLNTLAWSPHSRHYAAVGGAGATSLMLLDQRQMSMYGAKRNPIVWQRSTSPGERHGTCQSISWHPFVPYWMATATDGGLIQLWDLRSTPTPVVSFVGHNGPVSNIEWCPSHSELLVSASYDNTYKLWNMAMEPHYLLFEKDDSAPYVHSGFFEDDSYNSFSCNRLGQVLYSQISPKYMNKKIHSKFDEDDLAEKRVESLIYNRDFTSGFEKAIVLANKHSRQNNIDKAHTLLMLCFQMNIEDSLSSVIKSTAPRDDMRKEFKKNMEAFSYFIPPSYYERFGTKLSTNLMTKIKELKINLDILRHIKNCSGEEIVEIEREIVSTLKADHLSIRTETIADLVTVFLNHDPTKCYSFVIQLVEIFKNKLPLIMPIIRLLIYPNIFEKNPLHVSSTSSPALGSGGDKDGLNTSGSTLQMPSKSAGASPAPTTKNQQPPPGTPTSSRLNRSSVALPKDAAEIEEAKLNEYLGTPEAIIQQLTFMRGYSKILASPTPVGDGSNPDFEDIIDFSSKNRPAIILSSSINRMYLSLLAESLIYDQLFIVLLNLRSVTEGFEFNEPLTELYEAFTPDFLSFIKNSQQRDKSKLWDSERYSIPLLTAISILHNVPVTAIPKDFYDTLTESIPVFIEELDNSFLSMLQQPDPSVPLPGKIQAQQKSKGLFEAVKSITDKHTQQSKRAKTASITVSPQTAKANMDLQGYVQSLNTTLNKYL